MQTDRGVFGMKKNNDKAYPGIDSFRIAAAFLVVAIHTSPLADISGQADFILTRILARTAVPFFFMTSGFFLISKYHNGADKLKKFLKHTVVLYGISMVLYLPVNLYNGYFQMEHLIPNMIKDVLFDGTFYHLWYLPASAAGAALAWGIVKKAGMNSALVMTMALYVVGLFGDSYYGAAQKLPVFQKVYAALFEVTDYTRNGVFFAPVFFVLGGIAAQKRPDNNKKRCLIGFLFSVVFMLAEGLNLHRLSWQRHDSMYLFLVPCVYFGFRMLTVYRGKRKEKMRTGALIIYILHPMCILVLRLAARITGTQAVFVENNFVHFLAVSAMTVLLSLFLSGLFVKWKADRQKINNKKGEKRAWIEIDEENLLHNADEIKKTMPEGCKLMAVIKADAYGHGAFQTAVCLEQSGVETFAVATIEEGIDLRSYGIGGEILILGYTDPGRAQELHKYDLIQTAADYAHAAALNRQRYSIKVHIKVDTGMHRLGFSCKETDKIAEVFSMKRIRVCGIYTHLCDCESRKEDAVRFTNKQLEDFYRVIKALKEKGILIPKVHMFSSYGFMNYPKIPCHYIRAGIILYGVYSMPEEHVKLRLDLRPVLSLRAKVILLRKIKSGESIGYGRAFVTEKDSMAAVVSIGYADGLPRSLSENRGEALVRGRRVQIIGKICMDQCMIDVTEVTGIAVGDTVTLIGKDGREEITAEETAKAAGTITNELLARMGKRLKRG